MDDIDKLSQTQLYESVAREVFNLPSNPGAGFWTDAEWRMVKEVLRHEHYEFTARLIEGKGWVVEFRSTDSALNETGVSSNILEAICRAALRVVRQGAKAEMKVKL